MKAGWHTKQLGDICRLIGGGTPSKGKMEYYAGNIPWATVRDMRSEVITETECKITKEAVKSSATNVIPMGNIVIATRVGLGKVCLLGQDTAINQDLRGIVPIDPKILSVRFLFWWLISITDSIVAEGTGATVQGVKLPFVRSLQAPVPPLAEQRRIVGILDEAFEGIATAKANAEKNLQNARAVFESHLNAVFTQRGPGWVERMLGDCCSFENGDRGTNYPSKSARTTTGIPFINAGHLTDDGIDLENMDFISRERFDLLSNGKIRKGDILFCLRGSLGKFASVGDLSEGAIASSLVIVRPEHTVLNEFVLAFLRSSLCSAMINRFKNGAAQPNLSAQSLGKFIVPVPPLPVQESVVKKLMELRTETQRLESIYEQKLTAMEALKRSLLHQAFVGGL